MVGMVVVESQDSSARGQSVIGHFRAGPSGLPFRRDGVHIYIYIRKRFGIDAKSFKDTRVTYQKS